MRWLALLLVSSVSLAGGRFDRFCRDNYRSSRGGQCDNYAFFELAPLSGAGMGGACTCAAVTGAKGEAVTFTRASNGTCTKGNPTTGIANGDLVICSTNQPRVGNPDGQGLALLVEASRQNVAIQNQAMDNAAWANFIAGAGTNPTKGGADTDMDPFGTATAEKVTFNATGASDSSGLSQTVLTAAAWTGSIYARGNATTNSGTFDVCLDNAATATCVACSYVLGSWTRCIDPNITSKASGKFYIGNLSSLNGGTTRSAQTVTLSLGQAELGAYATSPIPTTTAAVTRAVDATPSYASGAKFTTWSMAATIVKIPGSGTTVAESLVMSGGFVAYVGAPEVAGGDVRLNSTHTAGALISGSVTTGTAQRLAAAANASNLGTLCNNGSCTTDAINRLEDGATNATFYFGGYITTAFPLNGYIRQVCFDPDPTRCR